MADNMIEAQHLVKTYGSTVALNDLSLEVEKGAIYGLIGNNGAGKTTFLKTVVGHIFPTSGTLTVFGQAVGTRSTQCRKTIGAIIEEPGFFPELTVMQNIEYYRIQKGIKDSHHTEELLHMTGLKEKKTTKASKLSMGLKQRLGLAIAMIGNPELLVLDEPINNLDLAGIIDFRQLIQRINTTAGTTILLSSHILSELEHIATTVGVLNNGQLIGQITQSELQSMGNNALETYYLNLTSGGNSHD